MSKYKKGITSSSNHINRLKRYQEYFDAEKTYYMTPNSRSLPRKKQFFRQFEKNHSNKKQLNKRKQSIPNMIKKQKKKQIPNNNNSPISKYTSKHKISRYDHSIGKQYDSPSKQNQQLDFILAQRPKNKKSGCYIETTIDKVYDQLTKNNLNQAIQLLKKALTTDNNNSDMNYLLGVCHLLNGSYDQTISIFDTLLTKKPRKNIYLLLSVCYKKKQDYEQTQKILNQCLKRYPKSYQTYIYRGKLFLKLKKCKQALLDFQKAIKINPDKQIGYIGKGDCLRLNQKYQQAKTFYAKALSFSKKPNPSILLRRAICNMQLKRYQPAFDDINQLLCDDPQNSQALYFKGLIYNKQSTLSPKLEMQNQSIICYQQAIKFNTNKKAVTRSIYQLSKIQIQHRDYYQALYTLQRASFLDIQQKVIRKFKIFADGITELMKKNFQIGIKILTQLIDQNSQKPIGNFLKPLIYSSRSYGYMSLCKFQQAKQDLQKLQTQFSLDIPNLYNKFICQGIMACNSQKYQQALAFFSKAGKIMPTKVQPYFYKAVTLVCFISKLIPKDMKSKQKQYLQSALKTINKCQRQIQNNPSLFLIRSFLHYVLGQANQAIQDLQKCMHGSTKPLPIHFYLNGMILAQHYQRYCQAIQQFKKALNAQGDHKIPQIYLNKAKCLLLLDQVNSGFVDLQTYMSFRTSSPQIHIWAGHLLFYIGATEDAAKAYSNINNISKNPQVLLYRAKCYLTSKNVLDTLANLKQILDIKYDNKIYFDYHIIDALRQCSQLQQSGDYTNILPKIKQVKKRSMNTGQGKFGYFVTQADYQFYKGVLYFYIKDYQNASKNFERSLKLTQQFITQKVNKNPQYLDFYKLSYNNIPFNYIQCLYNICISEIMSGNILKGKKKLKVAIQKCSESQTKTQLQLFLHLLDKQLINQFDKKNKNPQQQQHAQLSPFPSQNRLCSIFPQFVIPLSTPISTRLYFCLPAVEKPDIHPKFDQKLFDEINMSTIEIKPQAPWIKRTQQGVIFTDDIVGCDISLSKYSPSQQQVPHEQDQQQQQQSQQNNPHHQHRNSQQRFDGNRSGIMDNGISDQQNQDRPVVMMNPAQLKKMLRLDPKVQAKLTKFK